MKRPCFLLGVVAAVLLGACDGGSKGSATPQAAAEFAEIEQMQLDPHDPMDREWRDVINHFAKHMDTAYASKESQFTILHIAAIFNKAELVRCLLKDGADANATTYYLSPETGECSGEDSALELALADISGNPRGADGIIATIDALLQGGAKAEVKGSMKTSMAATAITLCEHESAVLHLMQQRPDICRSQDTDAHMMAAWKGWESVLKQLLTAYPLSPEEAGKALFTAAGGAFQIEGKHSRCIHLLLEHGAPINSRDEADRTPIFAAATTLLQTESNETPYVLSIIEQLLNEGADATLCAQDEEYPGCSAYDLLRMHPTALEELAQRGHKLEAPPLLFTPGLMLLSDVCKAKQRGQTTDVTLQHYDAIATILRPTADMQDSPIYPEALENAISLLCEADAHKTANLVANMPLWHSIAADKEASHHITPLLSAIRNAPNLILPAELLCQAARDLQRKKMNDEAATIVEWLGRDEHAQPYIEQMKQAQHPALQAGAWSAILLQKQLPAPRVGEIQYWIEKHPQADKTHPALQKALLLTSLQELWTGEMPANKQKQLIAAMREIGAPNAANQYEKIAQNLHDAEVLDQIMDQPDDWKFELEIATAQFILQNEQAFHKTPQQNTD